MPNTPGLSLTQWPSLSCKWPGTVGIVTPVMGPGTQRQGRKDLGHGCDSKAPVLSLHNIARLGSEEREGGILAQTPLGQCWSGTTISVIIVTAAVF